MLEEIRKAKLEHLVELGVVVAVHALCVGGSGRRHLRGFNSDTGPDNYSYEVDLQAQVQ